MVILDIGDRGVLQVFLSAEHGLSAVRMSGENCTEHSLRQFAVVLSERHVLFLIDGFKLGVESADDGVLESVSLNAGPVVKLVRGDILDIACHVLTGVSVGACRTDGVHELVVFVGDGEE